MTTRPFSLYIHVPYCAQKCPYCDFNTYATPKAPEGAYVESLCRELTLYAQSDDFAKRPISTVFFGGGTPSVLSAEVVSRFLTHARSLFPWEAGAEVSLEANPSGISLEKLQGYRAAGVNRLSFGVQSFNPDRLRLLGRDHTVEDAQSALGLARSAGFDNLSLDLIYGVPGQTLQDLHCDLDIATSLPIDHLSAYALTIEQGTPFYQRQERGLLTMPPDDIVAEMMDEIPRFLQGRGFERYEISNFARSGQESRHNTAYWVGADYLGIGAGAHSLVTYYEGERRVGALRWCNLAQPDTYMKSVESQAAVSWRDKLDAKALMFEFFYLGLRCTRGVSRAGFEKLFGVAPVERFGSVFEALASEGFLELDQDTIRLTPSGIKLSDSVFERFA
jgi:oxygen-independent coproporphyrinogen-3 oxidase